MGFQSLNNPQRILLHGMHFLRLPNNNDEGKQDTYVLSMMEPEALTKSPAYIIQQNDMVYVQPNNYRKRQSANASDTSNGSFWVSVVSVLTTIAVLLFK